MLNWLSHPGSPISCSNMKKPRLHILLQVIVDLCKSRGKYDIYDILLLAFRLNIKTIFGCICFGYEPKKKN